MTSPGQRIATLRVPIVSATRLLVMLLRHARWLTGSCALAASLLTGCQSMSFPKKLPWSKETVKESEFQTPVRLAALWSEDVLTTPGETPVRGFGARIYFYNDRNQTIPVEGQLVVYGYDDSSSNVSSRAPDRKFVFTAEQFSKHFSKSDLGASYSVWIPWEPVGGPQKDVSLIPVFTSSSGKIVVGPQGINVLSGSKKASESSEDGRLSHDKRRTMPAPDVRTVNHWELAAIRESDAAQAGATNSFARDAEITGQPTPETPDGRRRAAPMRTSTIFVPNTLGRRMTVDADDPAVISESPQARSSNGMTSPGAAIQPPSLPAPSAAAPPTMPMFPSTNPPPSYSPPTAGQPTNHGAAQTWVSHGTPNGAYEPQPTAGLTDPSAGLPNPWQTVPNVAMARATQPNDPRQFSRATSGAPAGLPPSYPSQGPPPVGYQSSQSQVPAEPTAQSSRGPGPWGQSPSAWQLPHGLPPAPQNPY